MRFQQYLNEEFLGSIKTDHGGLIEIFENPSPKEVKEASKKMGGVRFILDATKKNLFVFSDYWTHSMPTTYLHRQGKLKWENRYQIPTGLKNSVLFGWGKVDSRGKIIVVYVDDREVKRLDPKKMKWAEKYFTNLQDFYE